MRQTPQFPQHLGSNLVLIRGIVRLILLAGLAMAGADGFIKTFTSLLLLGTLYCAFSAVIRREDMLGPVLTHWDEAAVYLGIGQAVVLLT